MFKNLSLPALGMTARQSEAIELALSFGFRSMDLDMVDFADQAKSYGLDHARRFIDSAKLKLGAFWLPFSCAGTDEEFGTGLQALSELADIAAKMNCLRCLTTIEPASDDRPYHDNFEFHRKRLAAVAKTLEPHGITLGVGFLATPELRQGKAFEFIHDLEALGLLVGMVGAKNVGVVLDTFQVHASGKDLEPLAKLTGQKVVAVLVADAKADTPIENLTQADKLLPGATGVVDNVAALGTLAEIGFSGPVSPSPSAEAFDGVRRDEIVRQAGAKLDELWKAAGVSASGKVSATAGS